MEEEVSKLIILKDVDIVISIRSGQSEIKILKKLLESLIASSKLNSLELKLLLTEEVLNIKSTKGKIVSSVTSTFYIE
jgi:hypothetical protein